MKPHNMTLIKIFNKNLLKYFFNKTHNITLINIYIMLQEGYYLIITIQKYLVFLLRK